MERSQAVKSELDLSPQWATSLHWSQRRPLSSWHYLPCSIRTLTHPIHGISSQSHLSASSFPPAPGGSPGFSPWHPQHLIQTPASCLPDAHILSHLPWSVPRIWPEEAGLTMSLPYPWGKVQTLSLDTAASVTCPPCLFIPLTLPKMSLPTKPPLTPWSGSGSPSP